MKKLYYSLSLLFLCLIIFAEKVFSQSDSLIHKSMLDADLQNYFQTKGVIIDTSVTPLLYEVSRKWMGTHYHYSGKSSKGIDCSGLTKIIYKEAFHDTLIGGSGDIVKHIQPISKNDLKTGDMVFFKIKKNRVSHIGVYLGNNKFVHAAVKGGVQINDLDEPYYKKRFYTG